MRTNTKGQLSHLFQELRALAPKMDSLSADQMLDQLAKLTDILETAKYTVRMGGFKPVYAAGCEHKPGEYGMFAGPNLNLEEVKHQAKVGIFRYRDFPVFIFECTTDENGHVTNKPIFMWDGEDWTPVLELTHEV